MERRMLLAIVLSFLAISGYSALMNHLRPPPKKQDASAENTSNGKPVNGEAGNDTSVSNPSGDDPSTPRDPNTPPTNDKPNGGASTKGPVVDDSRHPQHAVTASDAVLKSTELEVGFTSLGGAISHIRLLRADEADQETPIDLVVPKDPTMQIGQLDDIDVGGRIAPGEASRRDVLPGPLRRLHWTRDSATEAKTGASDVVYTFDMGNGITLRKQWVLGQGDKRFDITLRMEARRAGEKQDGAPDAVLPLHMLVSASQYREIFKGAFATPSAIVKRTSDTEDVEDTHQFGLEYHELDLRGTQPKRLRVLGSRSHYFALLYYGAERGANEPPITAFWATGEEAAKRGLMEEAIIKYMKDERGRDIVGKDNYAAKRVKPGAESALFSWITLQLPILEQDASAAPVELNIFAGPLARDVLGQDAYKPLNSVITYPSAFDFVAKFLLWLYDFWRNLFGSAGVGVILMTLCVRGAMMPISIKNQLSMRRYGKRVAKLKPKVAALQERYAKNPKKLRDEQMKLYRENGVGFPTGCLMMLIQIPIFFALFSALRVEYTLRGAPFLWIDDLSGPDKLIDFGGSVLNLGILDIRSLNILPLIMVALSIWHTRSMPKPADEQQAQQMKMMKWLPIIFAVILYNYTAALALYMVMSSAFAIIESKIVRAKDEADEADEGDLSAFPAKA